MRTLTIFAMFTFLAACSDSAGSNTATNDAGTNPAPDGGSNFDTPPVPVTVPASGRVYVKLGASSSVVTPADPMTSSDWDVAFEGFDVFTNSGPSGHGQGSSFGPVDPITFLGDTAPTVPFLTADKAGGAFLDWYKYDGTSHALWSRYHVFGIRDGARTWKVQVLSYNGVRDGATISALYQLRYAELTPTGAGPTQEVVNLDGTAGGPNAPVTSPSECIDFGTGTRSMLTPEQARTSSSWHLCARRQSISVNGEFGGPRNTGAVDLEADKIATEAVAEVMERTAESEKAKFDAITLSAFDNKVFRGDRVVSGIGDRWIDRTKSPIEPSTEAWLVVDSSNARKYLLGFSAFQSPTTTSPGTVVMHVKPMVD